MPKPEPVAAAERLVELDVLRGAAVLGILLINIVVFAFPYPVADDPTLMGGATGANLFVFAFNYMLFDGKMRAIFSLLFGGGVILFSQRAGRVYFRRVLWLLVIGLLHAYLIWSGDILYTYALTGLILYPLRNAGARWLIVLGLAVFLLNTATKEAPHGKTSAIELQKIVDIHQGNYPRIFHRRAQEARAIETDMFLHQLLPDALGMMLIGMGLFKLGFLSGNWSDRQYFITAILGYAIGLCMNGWTLALKVLSGFQPGPMLLGEHLLDWQRLAVALGHISVLLLVAPHAARLAAVGRMALTNYLLQSVICTMVFYGYGFGLFGKLERWQIYGVVALCWAVNLTLSPWWLARYRYGPVEWAWRSLTYWERLPLRRVR